MREVRFSSDAKEEEGELSPEVAERLYNEGGFYIVKDLPPGTELGCDMKSWNTGMHYSHLHFILETNISNNLCRRKVSWAEDVTSRSSLCLLQSCWQRQECCT